MSPHPPEPAAVELGDYLGIIRRRYLVVGLAVLVCLVIGIGYGVTRPDVFRSTSEIALPAPEQAQTPAQSTADVQTELAVLRSDLVAERAAQQIGGVDDPRDLLDDLTVEAPPDSRVLVIVYSASTAEAARAGAGAFAEGYIAVKEDEQRSVIEQQVQIYDEQIAPLDAAVAEQDEILASADEESQEYRTAVRNRDDLASQRSELARERASVESRPVDGGTIITPARLPRQPKAKGLGRTIAAALAAGLVLGLAAAFVLDRLDTRVRGAADLQAALGVRSLGSIPVFPEGHRNGPPALVTVHAPGGPEADAFRRLRTSILLQLNEAGVETAPATDPDVTAQPSAKTLAITSAVADEGKSTVAANLAVAVAMGGRKVLLISADLRRPGVEELIENAPPTSPGLSDILRGDPRATLDLIEHRMDGGLLAYILAGSQVDNPTDLLASQTMTDAIPPLAEGYDLVIFDTPPVLAAADVLVLAPKVDATLLVVSLARASTTQVSEAVDELRLTGANVIGAVINNDADSRRSASAAAYGLR